MSSSITHKICHLISGERYIKFSSILLRMYSSSTSPKLPSKNDANNPDEVPVFEYPKPSRNARRVYAWGVSETGALGIFTATLRKKMRHIHEFYDHPRRLTFSHVYEVKDVACGYGFTLFSVEPNLEKGPHKVFGCGINTDSQIGYHTPNKKSHLALLLNPAPIEIPLRNPKTKVHGLAAGRAHSVILTEEGVFTLGNNAYGQCGRPVIENENYDGSKAIHHIPDIDGIKIKSIACGQDHSLFITVKGEVYACGWNADGQTGQNSYDSHWELKCVTGDITGEDIMKVACAGDCVLALNSKGQVFGWGNAEYGQLGGNLIQLATPKHLVDCEKLGRITDIAAGGSLCMVLNEDGQVFTWGYGILGKGPNVERSLKPTEIPQILFGKNEFSPDSKVVSITCGLNHQMALTNKGELFAWGLNRGGCLGLGHDNDQYFPFRVSVGAAVSKVCCGVDHTVAICQPH